MVAAQHRVADDSPHAGSDCFEVEQSGDGRCCLIALLVAGFWIDMRGRKDEPATVLIGDCLNEDELGTVGGAAPFGVQPGRVVCAMRGVLIRGVVARGFEDGPVGRDPLPEIHLVVRQRAVRSEVTQAFRVTHRRAHLGFLYPFAHVGPFVAVPFLEERAQHRPCRGLAGSANQPSGVWGCAHTRTMSHITGSAK